MEAAQAAQGLLEGAIDAHLGARAAREAAIRGLEGGAEEVVRLF